jgi:hypothetical protein
LAQYTAEVLLRKLVKARAAFLATALPCTDRAVKTKEGDGFCHGWVTGVAKTVQAFALTPELRQFILDETERLASGGSSEAQRRGKGATFGSRVGYDVGSKESIQRPVSAAEPSPRLLS